MRFNIVFFLVLLFYTCVFYAQVEKNNDSILKAHNNEINVLLSRGDTVKAIKLLHKNATIYSTMGKYAQSYDSHWETLILATKIKDSSFTPSIYKSLGVLYSIFSKDEDAEKYFKKSINILKNTRSKTKLTINSLRNTYYILASHNRENGDNGIAQKYLDSCTVMLVSSPSVVSGLLAESEQAYIYANNGQHQKGIKTLKAIESEIILNIPSYQGVYYSMMGEMYYNLKNYLKSEKCLLKSIESFKKYNSNTNYTPDVYEKTGNLYLKMGQAIKAYSYLQKSKSLNEELFGIRSKNNIDLLEVKDAFRIENEKQSKTLEQAELKDLQQTKKILFLRNLVLTVLFVSLVVISIIVIRNLQKRRKFEQQNFESKQKLNKEKNYEILNVKNKELTSSALQLIQKDELILEIKEALINIKSDNLKGVKQILNKIKINKNQDWQEFNARFTSVNKSFYKILSNNYPELTRRDHKLCALIKLNFTSKEISQLLGISMESVNTARYRLRKKMGLNKEDNLVETISKL